MKQLRLMGNEKNLLGDMLETYCKAIDEKQATAGEFIWLAHESGDIESSGAKYEENKKFWEVRDNIKKHLQDKKDAARKLIYELTQ